MALVAGRNRVPSPATGKTALRIDVMRCRWGEGTEKRCQTLYGPNLCSSGGHALNAHNCQPPRSRILDTLAVELAGSTCSGPSPESKPSFRNRNIIGTPSPDNKSMVLQ